MAAVLYRLRSELRTGWRSLVALTLLAGVAGTVVLATVAGARRTSTAYTRFVESSQASDLLLSLAGDSGPPDYSVLERVPGVARVAPIVGVQLVPTARRAAMAPQPSFASLGRRYGYEVDRPNLFAGRMPRADRPNEVFANHQFAVAYHASVGSSLELAAVATNDNDPFDSITPTSARTVVTIAGIGVFADDVYPTTDLESRPRLMISEDLARTILSIAPEAIAFDAAEVTIQRGRDPRSVIAAMTTGHVNFNVDRRSTRATVARAIRPQSTALWAFAIVAAVASLVVITQALARTVALAAADNGPLRAVGLSPRALSALSLLKMLPVAVGAAALSVLGAVGLSSRFPIGPSRLAEPHRGTSLNVVIVVGGAAVLAILVMAITAMAAAFVARRPTARPARPSRVAAFAASIGASPRLVIGTRHAFEAGRGRAAVPVRSALITGSVAVAAVIATVTFGASLDGLVNHPARYGQTWDIAFDAGFAPEPAAQIVRDWGHHEGITGIGGINYGAMTVGRLEVPAIGYDALAGDFHLTVTKGREPRSDDEVVLGERTMRQLGAGVGSVIDAHTPIGPRRLTVVGSVVFPQLSQGSFSVLGLGTGAAMRSSALAPPMRSVDDFVAAVGGTSDEFTAASYGRPFEDFVIHDQTYAMVVITADGSHRRQVLAALKSTDLAKFGVVRMQARPAAIANYAAVRSTPAVLALLLAALGCALIVHVLVTAVRRRGRELATCKAIGMQRRDVSAIVGWQALALVGATVVIGVPLGLAGGHRAWSLFAHDLGVPANTVIPALWLGLVVAGTLAVGQLAAALPAWRAGRIPAAWVLRTE